MSVRRLLVILISAFLCACTADLVEESPPSAPSTPVPANNAQNQVTTGIQLRWKPARGDGATTVYDVYFGTEAYTGIIASGLEQPRCTVPYRLLRTTSYRWYVETFNSAGRVKSDVWTFTTGIGDNPDVPVNTWPANGSDQVLGNVVLEWTGSDADRDTLMYDIYLGHTIPAPLVVAGTHETVFVPEQSGSKLDLGTYYWHVVARDRFGLTTEGPTWTFNAIGMEGRVYTWAGTGTTGPGAMGQPPRDTQLYWPADVSFSQSGTPFVVDWNNHRIIAPDASGNFKLLAGGVFGDPCLSAPAACQDIVAAGSELNQPTDVAFDADGNIALAAWHNSELFLIDKNSGLMDRVVGTGGPSFTPDGQPAATSGASLISSAAFDSHGQLYYTDQANMVIRKIDENGLVHTVAGTNPVWDGGLNKWISQFGYGGDEGPATSALFNFDHGQLAMPSGRICFDAEDNMYIADTGNRVIRRVDTSGIIHLVAGIPESENSYYVGPRDIAMGPDGNLYIADSEPGYIIMSLPDGYGGRIAGTYHDFPSGQFDAVQAYDAKFLNPLGIAVDARGNVWIADTGHSRIRILFR